MGVVYKAQDPRLKRTVASFSKRLKEHSETAIQSARNESMAFLIAATGLGAPVALILLIGFCSLFRILRSKLSASSD